MQLKLRASESGETSGRREEMWSSSGGEKSDVVLTLGQVRNRSEGH